MRTFDIHKIEDRLSGRVDQAAGGESFVIAKADKPVAKVVALYAPQPARMKRRGFMAGQIAVPDAFDRRGRPQIADPFSGGA